ncbi:MAG: DNA/RNA non-specific endonuclease, partial [Bacteroidales bacterium]|nr:DNA/RNA non-specific endonuclease [Bacteroidales bacterium]
TGVFGHSGWMELPAKSADNSSYYYGTFYGNGAGSTSGKASERNYSYLYDKSTYTSYWVAYPLYSSTMGGSRGTGWAPNPAIAESSQVNCWDYSYNVAYGQTNWSSSATSGEYYARGHQIPDADRSGHSTMQSQTYFATNSTPQIQNSFNGGTWMYLEGEVRNFAKATDTLYVVTGACLQTVGGNEKVTMIHPRADAAKDVPVPNYYWKVLLKVKRGTGGAVTSASAIGYWMEHKVASDYYYQDCVVSVDLIEQYTGFDFFANLPGDNSTGIEKEAEANTDVSKFSRF